MVSLNQEKTQTQLLRNQQIDIAFSRQKNKTKFH
jgi:hypothetical protein